LCTYGAEGIADGVGPGLDRVGVGHVRLGGDRVAVGLGPEVGRQRLGEPVGPRPQGDAVALAREPSGERFPERGTDAPDDHRS
jgi:hypothetical protein